jgi:hypothetical protein
LAEIWLEGPNIPWNSSQKLKSPARTPDLTPGLEQVLNSLALCYSTREQKRAGRAMLFPAGRAKAVAVSGIGNHADFLSRSAVPLKDAGDVVGWNENQVCELNIAQATLM